MNYIEYYNQYKDKIFSYFYYNLRNNRELAEDLTSDTFMKWYEKIDTYDNQYNFSTWIFTIARNKLIDYYRKEKVEVSIDNEENLEIDEFLKYEQDFVKKIDTEFKMEDVYLALEKIPSSQKEFIIMKYLNEFSTQEIANMSGKTEANIRKIISRWLQKLSSILKTKVV